MVQCFDDRRVFLAMSADERTCICDMHSLVQFPIFFPSSSNCSSNDLVTADTFGRMSRAMQLQYTDSICRFVGQMAITMRPHCTAALGLQPRLRP